MASKRLGLLLGWLFSVLSDSEEQRLLGLAKTAGLHLCKSRQNLGLCGQSRKTTSSLSIQT